MSILVLLWQYPRPYLPPAAATLSQNHVFGLFFIAAVAIVAPKTRPPRGVSPGRILPRVLFGKSRTAERESCNPHVRQISSETLVKINRHIHQHLVLLLTQAQQTLPDAR
jgi:hypothetical protein